MPSLPCTTQACSAPSSASTPATGSIPKAPVKTVTARASGGRSYTVSYYSDGKGNELGEYWLVHGMGHAWSGGDPSAQYADPQGPDESAAMWDFFMSHPMGDPGPALAAPHSSAALPSLSPGAWALPAKSS